MIKATVTPISSEKINRLQNSWSIEDYKAIIELLGGEYSDLEPAEVEEYMHMMISDNDVAESAYELLNYALGDDLSEGQLRNLANEMEEDKMWEEYPDMAFHREIFKVNQLLYRAYNGKVPKGEAIVLKLKVISSDPEYISLVLSKDADAVFRLILNGTDSHSKLHRLFDEEVAEEYIDEAKHILWHIGVQEVASNEVQLSVTSSQYWLDSYDDETEYVVQIDLDIYKQESDD